MNIIFLAAGKGSRLSKLNLKNKCLINIKKKTLIERLLKNTSDSKIKNIFLVTGHNHVNLKKKLNNHPEVNFIYNRYYQSRDMLYSLVLGLKQSNDDTIISYTDILYKKNLISRILKFDRKKIFIPVLTSWKKIWKIRKKIHKDDAEDIRIKKLNSQLLEIGGKADSKTIAQYMGIIFIPKSKKKFVINEALKSKYKKTQITQFLNYLCKKEKIVTLKTKSFWYEFDDIEDFNGYNKNYN